MSLPSVITISNPEPIASRTRCGITQFILSINDTPGAREVFGQFAIEAVETTYHLCTATAGGGKRAGELIVTGGHSSGGI